MTPFIPSLHGYSHPKGKFRHPSTNDSSTSTQGRLGDLSAEQRGQLPAMLEQDRRRESWSAGRAAWRLGVSVREFRELEAGASRVG
ncbi:MAG TPA: hypothetical protein VGZ50_00885 [Actinomycetota bacterium]|nr:hypothetical protein [Actinomycetota bacterium]